MTQEPICGPFLGPREERGTCERIPSGCRDPVSIEAVVTHESGHVWGLDHVDEGLSPYLTMSPITGRCDRTAVSLGLGDVQGVQVKN